MSATAPSVDDIAHLEFAHSPPCEAEVTIGTTRACRQRPASGVLRCTWPCGAARSWLICDDCTAALRRVWARASIPCPVHTNAQKIRHVGQINPLP